MAHADDVAYAIIEPHFDAIRDIFLERALDDTGRRLKRLSDTKLVVSEEVRTSPRHFAACRDDGLLVVVAPDATELDFETLVALLCHELGHAADFLYPARWLGQRGGKATWLGDDTRHMGRIRQAWADRNADQVEWDADSIAFAVTGKPIRYCGACMIQCFAGGVARPAGLR